MRRDGRLWIGLAGRFFSGLLVALVLGWGAAARAECPDGLAAAAEAYQAVLNAEQAAVRGATLASPRGIEQTVQFDLSTHACHRGPGQAYREYGPPRCLPPGDDGVVAVRYPYRLFFRRALTLEELFEQPWEEGSDGILQVRFGREDDRWIPLGRKEILDFKKGGEHPGMAPRPGRNGPG